MPKLISANLIEFILLAVLFGSIGYFAYLAYGLMPEDALAEPFSGTRALNYAIDLSEFGERPLGSTGGRRTAEWLSNQFDTRTWRVINEGFLLGEVRGSNVIAIRPAPASNNQPAPVGIIATHFDSRLLADADPDNARQQKPSLAANRSLSGAAVLLELARSVDFVSAGHTICMAFFDGEENEGVPDWQGQIGSRLFVQEMNKNTPQCANPRFVVLVAMVGDNDLQLQPDVQANPVLSAAIWQIGKENGSAANFDPQPIALASTNLAAFVEAGWPTTLLTDRTFAQRNTHADQIDMVHSSSLERVGRVLEIWLEQGADY